MQSFPVISQNSDIVRDVDLGGLNESKDIIFRQLVHHMTLTHDFPL